MNTLTRRRLLKTAGILGATAAVGGGSFAVWNWRGNRAYDDSIRATYRPADLTLTEPQLVLREIARYATLAPNSHNSQPWRIELEHSAIVFRPDLSRRCPAVDPDDHHLFVSLGCAAENAITAGLAFGLRGEASFNSDDELLRVTFLKTKPQTTPHFDAIPKRQTTRAVFDGKMLSSEELRTLEKSVEGYGVKILLLSSPKELESILELVVEGNRVQMGDPQFVAELRDWIRASYFDAVQKGDGLFFISSGHSAAPKWIGQRLFDLGFTLEAETSKYTKQIRSSAGIAIFVGTESTKSSWADIGRSFERFALQATSMGILHSHINQPVEVPAIRNALAEHLGLKGARPDLVIRFGRGQQLPKSLRRPLNEVISTGQESSIPS